MFIDNGIGSYNPITGRTIHPIYSKNARYEATHQSDSSLAELNRNVLRRFALLALADHDMLKGRLIDRSEFALSSDPGPEKTYTFQVYPEDIGHYYDNRVMFANTQDVNTLVAFLERHIDPATMRVVKRSIGGTDNGDPVEKVAREWRAKWNKGEEWPLEA